MFIDNVLSPFNQHLGRPSIVVKDNDSYEKLNPGLTWRERMLYCYMNYFPTCLWCVKPFLFLIFPFEFKITLLERLAHRELWNWNNLRLWTFFRTYNLWKCAGLHLKSNIFEEFKLKKAMGSRKLLMQVMQKVPTEGCFYITCLFIFMQNILPIIRHIFLSFLSNCSNSTSSSSWTLI